MRGLAAMGVIWACSSVLVWVAGEWTAATAATVVLCVAMLVFALGECLHGAIHAPLGVDLAPPRLIGRYLALSSLSWQVGWIVGPAGGGFVLQHAPLVLWPAAAAINLACAGLALALERRLPERVRRTPRVVVEPEPLSA
jgi:MFS family permease